MAAALGNQYAAKHKRWTMALERALEKRSRVAQVEALDLLAEKLLAKCDEADLGALKELGDRLEGKPAQSLEHSGPDGKAIPAELHVRFIG